MTYESQKFAKMLNEESRLLALQAYTCEYMHAQADGWIDGCMHGWVEWMQWMDWVDGCMNECMDACMDEAWIDHWMDGCMDG